MKKFDRERVIERAIDKATPEELSVLDVIVKGHETTGKMNPAVAKGLRDKMVVRGLKRGQPETI